MEHAQIYNHYGQVRYAIAKMQNHTTDVEQA